MSNAIMNQVYNHYLTSYAPKSVTRQDTHKKSELRQIYNSMVKLNKEAPIYLIDTSNATREFAVGIKEQATELRSTIKSLSSADSDAFLNKKTAYSDKEDIVQAKYIGSSDEDGEVPSYAVKVHSLASPQVNLGAFLPSGKVSLPADTYSFDVGINGLNYEFQFGIRSDETNLDVQKRLERLINNADIGLEASVIGDNTGRSSLRLASVSTGIAEGQDASFYVNDDKTSKSAGAVVYFGLGYMAMEPKNASYAVNDVEYTSPSNEFTIGNQFQVTLSGISSEEDDAVAIGLKTDLDSFSDNIHSLAGSYNTFIKTASEFSNSLSRGTKLVEEMRGLSASYKNELDSLGIKLQDDGTIAIDDSLLRQNASESSSMESFQSIKDFSLSLLRKTGQITLNPMEYVNNVIVAYKNPGKSFVSPYVTSPYSGMLFSSYC